MWCKAALPKDCKSACDCHGAWSLNGNETITSVMDGKCLETMGEGSAIVVSACTGKPNQKFEFKPSGKAGGAFTVEESGLCVDQGL